MGKQAHWKYKKAIVSYWVLQEIEQKKKVRKDMRTKFFGNTVLMWNKVE